MQEAGQAGGDRCHPDTVTWSGFFLILKFPATGASRAFLGHQGQHEAMNRPEKMPLSWGGSPGYQTSVPYTRCCRRQPKKCIRLSGAENLKLGIESQLLLAQKLRASLSTDCGGSVPPPGRSQVPSGRKPAGSPSHTTVLPLRSADTQPGKPSCPVVCRLLGPAWDWSASISIQAAMSAVPVAGHQGPRQVDSGGNCQG